jgi:hypothetical protein
MSHLIHCEELSLFSEHFFNSCCAWELASDNDLILAESSKYFVMVTVLDGSAIIRLVMLLLSTTFILSMYMVSLAKVSDGGHTTLIYL